MPVTLTKYEPGKGLEVTEHVHIEPANKHRRSFARWGLAQEPPVYNTTERGWDVPLDLYPQVPAELLDGALVDGYPYAGAAPAPAPAKPVAGRTEGVQAPRKRARSRSGQHQVTKAQKEVTE